MGPWH